MPANTFSWQSYMNAWNTGNINNILEHYADDCEVIGAQPQPIRGKDALKQDLQKFFKAFSDVNGDAEVLVARGEYVTALLNVTSTHSGPLDVGGKTIPATNKHVEDKLAVFLQLDSNGKIAKEWDVGNQLSMFQQLGVAPPQLGSRIKS